MTAETDQTVGQLDEATVLRVLEMLRSMETDEDLCRKAADRLGAPRDAQRHEDQADILFDAQERLVAMYRASLGLEEA